LHQAVARKLAESGYAELRTLNVVVTGRNVMLRGKLTSFYLKQVAQSVVSALPDVDGLCNEIEVVPAQRR
jgi:osmotically-inducible protein OsmY